MKVTLQIEVEVPDNLVPPSIQPAPYEGEPTPPPYTAMDQLRGILQWAAKNWVVRGLRESKKVPDGPWRHISRAVQPFLDQVKVKITEVS